MAYKAEVIADSITEEGERLTTLEISLPRAYWPEALTVREWSRNAESSRARPTEGRVREALEDPYIPIAWAINQRGMQAGAELSAVDAKRAERAWLEGRDHAVIGAVALLGGVNKLKDDDLRQRVVNIYNQYGHTEQELPSSPVHKQWATRGLEPYLFERAVITATEWDNFFALRDNPLAQPEMQHIAQMMRAALNASQPQLLHPGEAHLPYIQDDERHLPLQTLVKMAVARCARISYLNHANGTRDIISDVGLHDSLLRDGHMSPFEHVAWAMTAQERLANPSSGNFRSGWMQYRKTLPGEAVYIPRI